MMEEETRNDQTAAGAEEPVELTLEEMEAIHRSEIREVLLGNLRMMEDMRLAVRVNRFSSPWGIADGAPETFIFGVMCKRYYYTTSLRNHAQAVYRTAKAMQEIGRGVYLETAPDAACCLLKSLVFQPVLLQFAAEPNEAGESELVLRAYCGRTLQGLFSIMRAISRFEKCLPEQVTRKKQENGK